jgi:hypothetical protein
VQESISIKIRNFTGFDLLRSSYGLSQGSWGSNDASAPPFDIANGGTATFNSESVDEFNGTSGFAEYIAKAGTFRIEWTVPFMGKYSLQVTMPPGYEQDTIDNTAGGLGGQTADAPSVKIILQPPE